MTGPVPRDEMVDGAGRLRPHWHGLLDTFAGLGREVLAERARLLDRAFADEGITSLLPGAGPGTWRCDPVPLIIPASEFAALEALLRAPQGVVSFEEFEAAYAGEGSRSQLPPASVVVATLNAKFGHRLIRIVRGVGYRLSI